jgi:hypothetical protein
MVKLYVVADIFKFGKKKYKYYNKKNKKCMYTGCSKKIYKNKKEMKKFKKTNFCDIHRCYIKKCKSMTDEGNQYCYAHKCNNGYCPNYSSFNGVCNNCNNIVNNVNNYQIIRIILIQLVILIIVNIIIINQIIIINIPIK